MRRLLSPSLLLALLLGMLVSFPLLQSGFFDVHDPTSAFRLYTLVDTIRDGQFPAAWHNQLNFGYGYPLHLYYAPLFGYLGAILYFLLGDYLLSVKAAVFVLTVIGISGVAKLVRRFGFLTSILAATAYALLPYRGASVYVRGSFAEYAAMALLPWLLYFWQRPLSGRRGILAAGSVTGLFFLAHNTIPLLAIPLLLFMIFFFQRRHLKGAVLASLLGFGLSAWFLVPVILQQDLIQAQAIAVRTDFTEHFLSLSQLWYSPWGYGGSTAGTGDLMSFMLGKGQVLLGLVGATYLLHRRSYLLLSLYALFAIFYLFMLLPASAPLWNLLTPLRLLQFPWRTLAFAATFTAVLAGFSILFFPAKLRPWLTGLAVLLLIQTNLAYFKPWNYLDYNLDILSSTQNLHPLVKDKIPEYLPAWMPSFPSASSASPLEQSATRVSGTHTQESPGVIVLDVAYMPHWKLWIDGQPALVVPSEEGLVQTSAEFPVGEYPVILTWHRTPVENISLVITSVTLLLMIGFILWPKN